MTVPFFDVGAINAAIDVQGAVQRVLNSKHYVLGHEGLNFEKAFADYIGVAHCAGVANGTDALELSLRALGVGQGHRVLMVANAAFYGSTAAYAVGATPVYVDVDEHSRCMSPAMLEQALHEGARVGCIIVTHLYGQMADMPAIMNIAEAHGIAVVEDCAQAHGARLNGRIAGSWGTMASFSFYPTKNLGALGDGGAVVSQDEALIRKVRALRQYGWSSKYTIAHPGGRNSRLDEMQAAILREKLPHLDGANARRQQLAQAYNLGLQGANIVLPTVDVGSFVGHLYVIQAHNRDDLAAYLLGRGIQTAVHYPIPDHAQPGYHCAQKLGSLPVTERLCQTALSLPCHPGMSDAVVEQVVAVVRAYRAKTGRALS